MAASADAGTAANNLTIVCTAKPYRRRHVMEIAVAMSDDIQNVLFRWHFYLLTGRISPSKFTSLG